MALKFSDIEDTMPIRQFLSLIALFLISISLCSAQDVSKQKMSKQAGATSKRVAPQFDKSVIKEAEELKKKLIQLNRELYFFEKELLYPTNTQLAVFLSLAPQNSLIIDSIEILLDKQLVASYIYKENEISALKKGGIQRVFLGSLSDGAHNLTVKFNGQGANNRYFKREKKIKFTKENDAKYIQMMVSESKTTREPLFKFKQW